MTQSRFQPTHGKPRAYATWLPGGLDNEAVMGGGRTPHPREGGA